LWFLNQLDSDNSAYHIVLLIRFQGRLDVAVLERSVNEIVQRHEALRTRLAVVDGVPAQFAVPEFDLSLQVVDVVAPPASDRFDQAMRQAREEACRPFDLAAGAAIRVLLLRVTPEDHLLVVTVHHVVCDGVGITTFMDELVRLYTAFVQGRPSPLEDLPVSYIEVARRRHQQLREDRLAAGIAYWQRRAVRRPDGRHVDARAALETAGR